MDIGDTVAPESDQLDAIELLGGPRIFTITGVELTGDSKRPVKIDLEGFPRPWRPCKNMRRVLIEAWGKKSAAYVGRQIELYRDPNVRYGKGTPGGTRISRMSNLNGPVTAPQLLSQGQPGEWTVQPLTKADTPNAEDWHTKIADSESVEELRGWWQIATPDNKARIESRVAELQAQEA